MSHGVRPEISTRLLHCSSCRSSWRSNSGSKIAPKAFLHCFFGISMTKLSFTMFSGILCGKYFVHYMKKFGYADLLGVLGRRFADFVRALDNLHEHFRFSYPKLRSPSFYCEREDSRGLILHYRTRRFGFISYVIGQLMEIAKMFYDTTIEVSNRAEKRLQPSEPKIFVKIATKNSSNQKFSSKNATKL